MLGMDTTSARFLEVTGHHGLLAQSRQLVLRGLLAVHWHKLCLHRFTERLQIGEGCLISPLNAHFSCYHQTTASPFRNMVLYLLMRQNHLEREVIREQIQP